jgi:hypothetical protein
MDASAEKSKSLKFFVLLATLLWAFVSAAASLSTNYTLTLPGLQLIIKEPGHVFQGAGGRFEPDPNTNVSVFHIPRIDPAKFTITSVSLQFTCYIGGAVWGNHDPANESLNAGVTTVVDFGSGSLLASSIHGQTASYSASGMGYSVHYDSVPVYDDNTMAQYIAQGRFYTDFGGGQNAFLDLPVELDAEAISAIYAGTIPSYYKSPGGALVFWSDVELEVRYDLETIGNANPGNLPPPPPPPAGPGLVFQQTLGNQATLVPPTVDLPGFVLNAAAMSITDLSRTNEDVRFTWRTAAGSTNYVQTGSSLLNLSDLSGPIVVPGSNEVTSTSFLDVGGATNGPARYYRIRLAQ